MLFSTAWESLLGVHWTARRSNQSLLKEICPEYSLERLMLKLKLQIFGHLMWRTDSFEKTLMLGKVEGRRRRGWDGWMISPTQWTWVWVTSRSWWWRGKPGVLQSMGSWLSNRTELNWSSTVYFSIHLCCLQFIIDLCQFFQMLFLHLLRSSCVFNRLIC